MIKSSEEYIKAVVATTRRAIIKAVVDLSDPDIIHEGREVSPSAEWSRKDELIDKVISSEPYYLTNELNRWLLNGKGVFLPDNSAEADYQLGYVSEAISGPDGVFETEIVAQINFRNVESLQAFTLFFPDNDWDGRPEDFTVEVLSGGEVSYSKSYTNVAESKIIGAGFRVNYPDGLRLRIARWSLPGRRARVLEIFPGLYDEWSGDKLSAFDVTQQADISNASLKYGTASLVIDNRHKLFEPRNKTGLFSAIEERQSVDLYAGVRLPDGKDELKPLGVFYQYAGGWTTSDNSLTMSWKLVDIIGLLNNREFVPPAELPTTAEGWLAAIVGQLGNNFVGKYRIDPNYASLAVTANSREDVTGRKCGEMLRYVCMATGTWPRADAETGFLTAEPLWNEGGMLDLDNLKKYPTMKGNTDIASVIFTLYGAEEKSQFVVGGTNAASDRTVSVNNPFLHTEAEALVAARQLLSAYGGNQIETVGRGDPASEIGDVDTVWLDGGESIAARRVGQSINIRNGVMTDCKTTLLQPSGAALYEEHEIIILPGDWTVPEGVEHIRVIIGGGGYGGGLGFDGSDNAPGADGVDGSGGMIWYGDLTVTPGQVFRVIIGAGGAPGNRYGGNPGDATSFGQYSSASGKVYPNGYTVASTGQSFGRSGVENPQPGTGDGGAGGKGGDQGYKDEASETLIPGGLGFEGKRGASGFVAVFWDKPKEESA